MDSSSLQSKRRPALLPRGVYLSSDDANALKSRVGDGLLPPPDPFISERLLRDSFLLKRSSQEAGNESPGPKKGRVGRRSERHNQSTTNEGIPAGSRDIKQLKDNPQRASTYRVQLAEPRAEVNDGTKEKHDTGDKQIQQKGEGGWPCKALSQAERI